MMPLEQGSPANCTRTDECLPSLGGGRTSARLRAWIQEQLTDLVTAVVLALQSQIVPEVKRTIKYGVSSYYEGCI